MTTSTTLPNHEEIYRLHTDDPTGDYAWAWSLGMAAARRHAGTWSATRPDRSILSDHEYARQMADAKWLDGNTVQAMWWYGYAAAAIRLDVRGGHAIAAR